MTTILCREEWGERFPCRLNSRVCKQPCSSLFMLSPSLPSLAPSRSPPHSCVPLNGKSSTLKTWCVETFWALPGLYLSHGGLLLDFFFLPHSNRNSVCPLLCCFSCCRYKGRGTPVCWRGKASRQGVKGPQDPYWDLPDFSDSSAGLPGRVFLCSSCFSLRNPGPGHCFVIDWTPGEATALRDGEIPITRL